MALGALWCLRASPGWGFLTRAFSATPSILRIMEPLPVFKPSSSPELDKVLSDFRERLVIPKHLSRYNRRRVFRQKFIGRLRKNPLVVMIGGESVTLRPITGHTPYFGRRDVTKVINQMVTPEDLSNIPPFLLGLRQIECELWEGHKQKIARTCSLKGRIDVLMDIARNAQRYGFLFTRQAAREFMRGLLVEQSIPGQYKTTMKALKHADDLMGIFAKTSVKVDPKMRLKRDPVVAGTALALFADTSLNYSQGVDVKGRTMELCILLKDECWQDVEWEQAIPKELPLGHVHGGRVAVHKIKEARLDYTPVLEGLLGAKELLKNTEVEEWLKSESERLAEKISEWDAFLKENIFRIRGGESARRMGVDLYRETAQEIYERERASESAQLQALKLETQKNCGQTPEGVLEDGGLTQEQRAELEALEKGM